MARKIKIQFDALPQDLGADAAGNLASLLLDKTGSIFGVTYLRLSAADQRRLFGRVVGKGKLRIDGTEETVTNIIKVCFGLDWTEAAQYHWRDLSI